MRPRPRPALAAARSPLSLPSTTVELREAECRIQELMQERDGFALERMEAGAQAWVFRRAAAPAVQARCNGRAMADHDGDHAGLQNSPKIAAEGLTREALAHRASSQLNPRLCEMPNTKARGRGRGEGGPA